MQYRLSNIASGKGSGVDRVPYSGPLCMAKERLPRVISASLEPTSNSAFKPIRLSLVSSDLKSVDIVFTWLRSSLPIRNPDIPAWPFLRQRYCPLARQIIPQPEYLSIPYSHLG